MRGDRPPFHHQPLDCVALLRSYGLLVLVLLPTPPTAVPVHARTAQPWRQGAAACAVHAVRAGRAAQLTCRRGCHQLIVLHAVSPDVVLPATAAGPPARRWRAVAVVECARAIGQAAKVSA
eukprot:760145-Pelagomonas_calceolata.AAC.5